MRLLPLILIVFVLGIISFLLISSTFPFKNPNLQTLFPKKQTFAVTDTHWFGVNDHPMWQGETVTQQDLDRMKQDGILTIRFDVDWLWLEPNQKGVYDQTYLTRLDNVISMI